MERKPLNGVAQATRTLSTLPSIDKSDIKKKNETKTDFMPALGFVAGLVTLGIVALNADAIKQQISKFNQSLAQNLNQNANQNANQNPNQNPNQNQK